MRMIINGQIFTLNDLDEVVSSSFRGSSTIMFGIIADDNQVENDQATQHICDSPTYRLKWPIY